MALAMNQLSKEQVQEIEMDIESCPMCGGTSKIAIFDGECIEYEGCPDPECVPKEIDYDALEDLSDLPF
jgi:hypothetical protein